MHEGGHIAEILDKRSGVNPLWTPPWDSIEPSTYDPRKHPEYGADAESKLLSGIMGHNLCMDIFGGPSRGRGRRRAYGAWRGFGGGYEVTAADGELTERARLPQAQLRVERRIRLAGRTVEITEAVENESEHRPAHRLDGARHAGTAVPGEGRDRVSRAGDAVAGIGGGLRGFRRYTDAPVSGGFTRTCMDPARDTAYFVAWSPRSRLALAYVWRRADFPWLGVWEENYSRTGAPWNGRTLTRGMEFGASPMAETRRQMIERGSLVWRAGVPVDSGADTRRGAISRGVS